jgi:hypothetical protein
MIGVNSVNSTSLFIRVCKHVKQRQTMSNLQVKFTLPHFHVGISISMKENRQNKLGWQSFLQL